MALSSVSSATLPWSSQINAASSGTAATADATSAAGNATTNATSGTTYVSGGTQVATQAKLWTNPQTSSKLSTVGQLFDLANQGASSYVSIDELSSMLSQVQTTWVASAGAQAERTVVATPSNAASSYQANGATVTRATSNRKTFSSAPVAMSTTTTAGTTQTAAGASGTNAAVTSTMQAGVTTTRPTTGFAQSNANAAQPGAGATQPAGTKTTNAATATGTTQGWAQAPIDPADANSDGVVTAAEQAIYDMTHPSTGNVFTA
jgi:hypothetical protein